MKTVRALWQTVCITLVLLWGCATLPAAKAEPSQSITEREGSAEQQIRRLTIDDLLSLENVGSAAAANNGRWIVYEKSPPYLDRGYFGVPRAWPTQVLSAIYGFNPMSDDRGRPLFVAEKGMGYWLPSQEPFSPNDHFLALYSVSNCRVSIAAFDFKRKRLIRAAHTPDVNVITSRTVPVWIAPHELVYPALPSGKQPIDISLRCHSGEQFYKAWKASWLGERPSYREVSNIDRQSEQPDVALNGRLIIFNAKTGKSRELANGKYVDLRISANGRYLAALKQSPKSNSQPREDWVWSRSELVIFDLSSGRMLKPAPELDVFPGSISWSPNDGRLAFFGWPAGMSVREFGKIHVFDANNSRLDQWPHTGLELASRRERGLIEQPERFFWVGSGLAILARPLPDRTAQGQFSYRGHVKNDPTAPLPPDWVLLEPNGKWRMLSAGLKEVSRLPLAVTGNALMVLADGDVWRLSSSGVKKNLSASYPVPLAQPDAFIDNSPSQLAAADSLNIYNPHSIILEERQKEISRQYIVAERDKEVSFAPVATNAEPYSAHRLLTVSNETNQSPTLLLELRLRGGGTKVVTLSNRFGEVVERDVLNQHLANTGPEEWKLLKYRSSISGHILESCMLLPFGYNKGQKYPAVLIIYPSFVASNCNNPFSSFSIESSASLDVSHKPHLLAANGYIVLRAVSPSTEQRTGDGPLDGMPTLITDAVNALIKQGFADPDRIGLIGVSQGGTAALWLAGTTNQFKAIVAANGWADYWTHYFQRPSAYLAFYHVESQFGVRAVRYEADYGVFGLGASPWKDPDAYIHNSPIFHVEDITAPILMINSDMDAFSITHYEAMYNALTAKKKPAKLITYWGEGHILTSPANIRHMWESVIRWYGKYLQ